MSMVESVRGQRKAQTQKAVTNFMGGTSYEVNPLDTLAMVTASSIFGEPQYYRSGEFAEKHVKDGRYTVNSLFKNYSILDTKYEGMTTSSVMEQVIDNALDYDYEGTLNWAMVLRNSFNMRLNPQVIMVRASIHPARKEFTEKHPGLFKEINSAIMSRADEPSSQLTYWLYTFKSKNKIPSILKRSWADRIESMTAYELNKYKNKGIGVIDTVRICHANSPLIDQLMQTGTIEVSSRNQTWEQLRASGMKWKEIFAQIRIPHMALLRNLRGIFTEVHDLDFCMHVLTILKKGVPSGKQFPFRYWSAMKAIQEASGVNHKTVIMDALEECIDISLDNMPKLKGKTMCLSDNSGSAWGSAPSEYGSVTIAEIDNLSSVITAMNSDEGYVGKFGDRLKVFPISKRQGALMQTSAITNKRDNDVGGSTENGIWLFFDNAIKNREHWDNIFIYSDQQAGHGGLYGTNPSSYREFSCGSSGYGGYGGSRYIDVAKLISVYRQKVNPNVNVFSVQTAGYDNVVIPEYGYRTNIMYGWTGKELVFADAMINFWNGKQK